ncbi:hypothetical protein CFC21_024295 [Triticum aestivum]|uniref:Uncharacterized protein n=2 Tax=Triticum aestivum TaxID=4565 RepID=A0A9R1ITI2_WHEAT|nr:hypothetical protein CFC21_009461 [Triticum aestivum]KAF7009798.1 hypothetical protein CFC21_024295 [Triticum aestivum]
MAVFRKNSVVAVCVGALMLMTTLLSSEGSEFVGCMEPHQNCFPDDCQKTCADNIIGKHVKGSCEPEHGPLKPYPALVCCCYRDGLRS